MRDEEIKVYDAANADISGAIDAVKRAVKVMKEKKARQRAWPTACRAPTVMHLGTPNPMSPTA